MRISSSVPEPVSALLRWWAPVPPDLTPGQRRYHAITVLAPLAGLVHVLYIGLFAWWGVWQLSLINIGSVALWVAIVVLFRRGATDAGTALLCLEVSLHSALVVLFVGWEFGAQYYLFAVVLVLFLAPWDRRISVGVTAVLTGLFVGLYYYAIAHPPLAEVAAGRLLAANIINTTTVVAIIAAAVLYPVTIADRAEDALAAEHERTEALLCNVLPTSIARRLKHSHHTIADDFPSASVLFADIVGFTSLAQSISPEEVVSILNRVFSRFDELVDDHGMEKIKTIGDAYMVAAGIPVPREDHADALARFALALRADVDSHNLITGSALQVRIGMNSGPVVAGVIGRRRFLYDLWGDTVNTAARMESHGVPGRIQVTEATRALLGNRYLLEERGVVDVKGKGPMRTFFLTAAATPAPVGALSGS